MLKFKHFQIIEKIQKESLGKRRYSMPQITNENMDEFKDWLKASNISFEEIKIPPQDLKATQTEFNKSKISNLVKAKLEDSTILSSSDNRVLDGHHRWIADIIKKTKNINVLKIGMPIEEILEKIKGFEKVEKRKLNESWREYLTEAFRK